VYKMINGSKKARNVSSIIARNQGGGPKKQGGISSVGHSSPYLQYIQSRAGFSPNAPYFYAKYCSTVLGRVGVPAANAQRMQMGPCCNN
jgi:hypothetical protein